MILCLRGRERRRRRRRREEESLIMMGEACKPGGLQLLRTDKKTSFKIRERNVVEGKPDRFTEEEILSNDIRFICI